MIRFGRVFVIISGRWANGPQNVQASYDRSGFGFVIDKTYPRKTEFRFFSEFLCNLYAGEIGTQNNSRSIPKPLYKTLVYSLRQGGNRAKVKAAATIIRRRETTTSESI